MAVIGDLAQLTPQQRMAYYSRVCESLGINPFTQPFQYIRLNNKLVLYATRTAADQLRRRNGVSLDAPHIEFTDGLVIVTVTGRDDQGRTDTEIGAVPLGNLQGEARANAIMKGFATALSDEDMKNVAYWVSAKKAKPGSATDKQLVMLGERIYRGGIAERQIAACAGCHSPNGAGIPAQYPRVAGQHAEYAEAQLLAFRSGARMNSAPMTGVAAKMNDAEIKAVSDYMAGLR